MNLAVCGRVLPVRFKPFVNGPSRYTIGNSPPQLARFRRAIPRGTIYAVCRRMPKGRSKSAATNIAVWRRAGFHRVQLPLLATAAPLRSTSSRALWSATQIRSDFHRTIFPTAVANSVSRKRSLAPTTPSALAKITSPIVSRFQSGCHGHYGSSCRCMSGMQEEVQTEDRRARQKIRCPLARSLTVPTGNKEDKDEPDGGRMPHPLKRKTSRTTNSPRRLTLTASSTSIWRRVARTAPRRWASTTPIRLSCGYNTLTRQWGKTQKIVGLTFGRHCAHLLPALGAAFVRWS